MDPDRRLTKALDAANDALQHLSMSPDFRRLDCTHIDRLLARVVDLPTEGNEKLKFWAYFRITEFFLSTWKLSSIRTAWLASRAVQFVPGLQLEKSIMRCGGVCVIGVVLLMPYVLLGCILLLAINPGFSSKDLHSVIDLFLLVAGTGSLVRWKHQLKVFLFVILSMVKRRNGSYYDI